MSDCDINGKARLQGFIVIIADKVSKIVTDYILGILYRLIAPGSEILGVLHIVELTFDLLVLRSNFNGCKRLQCYQLQFGCNFVLAASFSQPCMCS
jgi:hypothetical protein